MKINLCRLLALAGAFAFPLIFHPAEAATLTVCPSGCQYPTIQGAIDHATNGDVIYIGKGHYFETINTEGKGLSLLGVTTRQAIIDGNGLGTVITIPPGGELVTIEYVTITRGVGPGGGLSVSGPLDLRHSLVASNYSTTSGGGIDINFLGQGRSVTIAHSTITNNAAAGLGGGIYGVGEVATITITDCTISNNTAGQAGGGIALDYDQSQLSLVDSNIIDNSAQSGGGAYKQDGVPGSSFAITNVVFSRNNATQDGGGLSLSGDGVLTNTVFAQNSAGTNGGGFTAYLGNRATQASVNGVYVIQNSAGDHGGGVYNANNLTGTGLVIANNQPDNCYQTEFASGCP